MRRLILGLLAGVCVLAQAGAAYAHEEINPNTFPTGKPTFFTFNAANETTADLTKVALTAPDGLDFGTTTKEPVGWTVNRTDQVITWTGGAVKPNHFEQWGFEIEGADQPGTLSYKVALSYADGKSDNVTVDVNAVAAGSVGSTAAKAGGSTSRANAALGIGVIALVLAGAGVVMGLRRGGPTPRPAVPEPSKTGASKPQDW